MRGVKAGGERVKPGGERSWGEAAERSEETVVVTHAWMGQRQVLAWPGCCWLQSVSCSNSVTSGPHRLLYSTVSSLQQLAVSSTTRAQVEYCCWCRIFGCRSTLHACDLPHQVAAELTERWTFSQQRLPIRLTNTLKDRDDSPSNTRSFTSCFTSEQLYKLLPEFLSDVLILALVETFGTAFRVFSALSGNLRPTGVCWVPRFDVTIEAYHRSEITGFFGCEQISNCKYYTLLCSHIICVYARNNFTCCHIVLSLKTVCGVRVL